MPTPRALRATLLATLLGVASAAIFAQMTETKRDSPNSYPSALPPRDGPPLPRIAFRVEAEIPILPPRPGTSLSIASGRIRVETQAGAVEVSPENGAEPSPAVPSPAAPEAGWVVSPSGRNRVRTFPEGRVQAEKMSRRGKGSWHRAWRLRVSGRTPSPPVILGRRVFFGSADGQVHCVRLDNGHRIWAVDLGDRVSMPIAAGSLSTETSGRKPTVATVEFVLAVPDQGASLVALDAYDGTPLAAHDVGRNEMLVTPPLLLDGGGVAVARVGYGEEGATLVILRMDVVSDDRRTGPG